MSKSRYSQITALATIPAPTHKSVQIRPSSVRTTKLTHRNTSRKNNHRSLTLMSLTLMCGVTDLDVGRSISCSEGTRKEEEKEKEELNKDGEEKEKEVEEKNEMEK